MRMRLWVTLAALLLSACGTFGIGEKHPYDDHPAQDLAKGIKLYEMAYYPDAIAMIQHSLLDGLRKPDQVRAYKYLAFSYCVSEKERLCREMFKKAFDINPGFDLQDAEQGHPIWGPVFLNVKNSKSIK